MSTFIFALLCVFVAANASQLNKQTLPERELLENPARALELHAPSSFGKPLLKQDGSRLDTPSRRLLHKTYCSWVAANNTCVLSNKSIVSLIQRSHSPTALMIADITTCDSATAESKCSRYGFCHWTGGRCIFYDYATGYDDSPCVQQAPSTLEYYAATLECPSITRRRECKRSGSCSWNAESKSCHASLVRTFFGSDIGDNAVITDLLRRVEGEGDKYFVQEVVKCAVKNDEASCTESCTWDADSERCLASLGTLIASVTLDGGGSDDAVCGYFSMLDASGCYVTSTQEECEANPACGYADGCNVNLDFAVDHVSAEDSDFEEAVRNEHNACLEITDEQAC